MHSIKSKAHIEKEFTKWEDIKLLDQFLTLNFICFKHWIGKEVSLHKKHVMLGTQRQIIAIFCFYVSSTTKVMIPIERIS